MEGSLPEPWNTFILLTLFLLYVIMAASISVSSFLPEKSASSKALRRVSLPVSVLLMYNYGVRLWSVLPSDAKWMSWIFFGTVTVGSILLVGLYLMYGLRQPEMTKAISREPASAPAEEGLHECLLKGTVSAIV